MVMAESLRSWQDLLKSSDCRDAATPRGEGQQEREQKLGGLDQNDATGGITVVQ